MSGEHRSATFWPPGTLLKLFVSYQKSITPVIPIDTVFSNEFSSILHKSVSIVFWRPSKMALFQTANIY
jgi:hypothetical protein